MLQINMHITIQCRNQLIIFLYVEGKKVYRKCLCGMCKKSPGYNKKSGRCYHADSENAPNDGNDYSVKSTLRDKMALICCFSTATLDPNNMLLTLTKYTYFMIVGSSLRNVKNCYIGDPDAYQSSVNVPYLGQDCC